MACFQAAYNYLDMLTELPSADPAANGQLLHRALLVALDPGAEHLDYYAHHHLHDDGGYLAETVDDCRAALAELPSYAAVAPAARRAAERIVAFQSCNTGEVQGDYLALERWARAHTPARERPALVGDRGRGWVLAGHLRADRGARPQPRVDPAEIAAIEGAYFPWIGALHSLLDNLVDIAEDYATGQRSLVGCYASSLDAATRMRLLAERSLQAARALPDGRGHVLLLAAMASFYLSTPEARAPGRAPVARRGAGCAGRARRLSMHGLPHAAAPAAPRARAPGAPRGAAAGRRS